MTYPRIRAPQIRVKSLRGDMSQVSRNSIETTGIRAVLMGPPGAGKTTQIKMLAESFGVSHITMDHMLQNEVASGSLLGQEIKLILSKGLKRVNDDVLYKLLDSQLDKRDFRHGFLMDQLPRSVEHAEMLDRLLEKRNIKLDLALELRINEEHLVQRINGRLIHNGSGRSYHNIFKPPKVEMTDDITGEPLVKRPRDRISYFEKRLAKHKGYIQPIVNYYKKTRIHREVNASQSIDDVFTSTQAVFCTISSDADAT